MILFENDTIKLSTKNAIKSNKFNNIMQMDLVSHVTILMKHCTENYYVTFQY